MCVQQNHGKEVHYVNTKVQKQSTHFRLKFQLQKNGKYNFVAMRYCCAIYNRTVKPRIIIYRNLYKYKAAIYIVLC